MNRIKLLREESKISQEELAKKLNLSKGIISLYENGKRKPSIDVLVVLSEYFHCSIDYILGNSSIRENSNTFPATDNPVKLPVLGKISAGLPLLATENIEGYEFAPSSQLNSDFEYFYLRCTGNSMNLKFNDGDLLLIQKQNYIEDGEIGVFLIANEDATVKKFHQKNDVILLEPMSSDPSYNTQVYGTKEVKIIGKVISYQGRI
jgi:repressor LexA